jgi:hypothetical protein
VFESLLGQFMMQENSDGVSCRKLSGRVFKCKFWKFFAKKMNSVCFVASEGIVTASAKILAFLA